MSESPDFGIDFSKQSPDDLKDALKALAKRHSETIVERDGALDERDDALDKLAMIEEGIQRMQSGTLDMDSGLGAAFARFSDFSSSPTGDYQTEIDDLQSALRDSEEALQDCKSTLERERKYSELMAHDEDMEQQQADLQQNILRSQNLESELNRLRSEHIQLESELAEGSDTITDLEKHLQKAREITVQECEARERQFEELQTTQSRSAELESKIFEMKSIEEEKDCELESLKNHIAASESSFETDMVNIREKLAASISELKDREKMMKKAEDELAMVRAKVANSSTNGSKNTSPVKNNTSLGNELDHSVVVETPKELIDHERALSLIQSEFPDTRLDENLVTCVSSVIRDLRKKTTALTKLERNEEVLTKRVADTGAVLQERTTLAVKSIKMLERSANQLAKHAGQSEKTSETEERKDSDDLNERAEAIIDKLGKQITQVDFRAVSMAADNKSLMDKLAAEKILLQKQLKDEMKKTLPSFVCKYLGHTEVNTSRPDQKALWQAIDSIRRGTDVAKMIELATCQHKIHAGQPWLATMYGRAQDGSAIISKPYLTLCSVGQVETYVIFVCYTRTGGTMQRRFWVHAVACSNNQAAETLSHFLIGQCEVAHQYRKSTKAGEALSKMMGKTTAVSKTTKTETASAKKTVVDGTSVQMREKKASSPRRTTKRHSTITSATAITAGVMSLALNDSLGSISESTTDDVKTSSSSSSSSSSSALKKATMRSSRRVPNKTSSTTAKKVSRQKAKASAEPAMMGFGSWIKKAQV